MKNKRRKTLAERIHEQVKNLNMGETILESMSDDSCTYIELTVGLKVLSVQFDFKGKTIQKIELHENIIDIVDQKKIF